MTKYFTFALFLFASAQSHATQTFTHASLNGTPTPEGADIALYVIDPANDKVLYSERAEQFQQPASLQKIITGAAARLVLGKDFRFETTVETTANRSEERRVGKECRSRWRPYQGTEKK